MTRANARQDFFDRFRRQVPKQVASGQQLDAFPRGVLPARQRIFPKLRGIAHRRPFAFKKQGRGVIDHGTGGKAGADEQPGGRGSEAEMTKRLGALVSQLDGECGNQATCRKGENAGKDPLREANVQSQGRAEDRRRRRDKPEESRGRQFIESNIRQHRKIDMKKCIGARHRVALPLRYLRRVKSAPLSHINSRRRGACSHNIFIQEPRRGVHHIPPAVKLRVFSPGRTQFSAHASSFAVISHHSPVGRYSSFVSPPSS